MKIPSHRFSGYGDLLQASWKRLWQQPIVFFPIVYRILGFLAIIMIVLKITKIIIGPETLTTDITSFIKIVYLCIIVILLFLFEFHVKSLQIIIFSKIASKKKVDLRETFKQSLSLYKKVVGVILLFLLAAIIVFGVVAGLILMSSELASEKVWMPLLLILVGLIAIGGFLLALFFSAWMVFWMPVVSYTKKKAFAVVRQCWDLLWKDGRHVWGVYLISLAISLTIAIVLNVIPAMAMGLSETSPVWWVIAFFIINFVVEAVKSAWMMLFTFSSFFKRYKPKVV